MELLLQAIEKKLSHVDSERNRWLQYKEEHIQASNNLREFQKSFHKEILVPIGSKALMPGHLYHTNEIFVGMYHGLFVKCSTDKALSVCEHRLGEAAKRIDALNVEHKMYKDRLELPIDVNIFGNPNEAQEIIEEYNEEEEKEWREKHKIRMREHKIAEAEERKRMLANDDMDIDAIFEQAGLMEELESELELLNVSDDDLQQHLQPNLQPNCQQAEQIESIDENVDERSQLESIDGENDGENDGGDEIGSKEFLALSAQTTGLNIEDKIKFYEIHLQKIHDYYRKNMCTIHNFDEFTDKRVTEECIQNAIEELQETLNNCTTETDHKSIMRDNIKCYEAETKQNSLFNANPTSNEPRKYHNRKDFVDVERNYAIQNKSKSELLIFYKSQLRNVMKSIAGCTIDLHSREEKRDLYEFLTDRIASLRDEIQKEKQIKLEEDFVDDEDIDKNLKQLSRNFESSCTTFDMDDDKEDETNGKRKISFASQPITVTFFEDDEPCVVALESLNNLMDSTFQFFNSPNSSSASSVCGDDEDSANSGHENHPMNSTNDCDMNFPVNESNESTMNKIEDCQHVASNKTPGQTNPSTLILRFNHSDNVCTATASEDDVINSPLDIYRQFGVNIGAPSGPALIPPVDVNRSPQLNTSQNVNNESKGNVANDSFSTVAKALEVPNIDAKPIKSILKNRNLVKHERAPAFADAVDDSLDVCEQPPDGIPEFTQVLGDIVERDVINETTTTTTPAQPNETQMADSQSNDASSNSQPKKRISLFKKSRMS